MNRQIESGVIIMDNMADQHRSAPGGQESLQMAPASVLTTGKDIHSVTVQTIQLNRLEKHINELTVCQRKFDWTALLTGAALSSLLPAIYEGATGSSTWWLYLILTLLCLVPVVLIFLCNKHRAIKEDGIESPEALKEKIKIIKEDISEIMEQAKLD